MTASHILALIDAAPAFADAQPLAGEELRRAGLDALDEVLAALRAATGDARLAALDAAALAIGSIVSAEALNETFAKAMLEEAAAEIGLVREVGIKKVRAATSLGLKEGKRAPREFGHAAFGAEALRSSADKGAEQLQSQPPGAADRISSFPALAEAFPGDPPAPAARRAAAAAETQTKQSSQMGGSSEAAADGGGQGGSGAGAGQDDGDRNMRLAFYPLTDLGNAERFVERARGRLLFNTALATTSPGRLRGWLAWDGKRWAAERGAEYVMMAEHDTVRAIQDEAEAVRASGNRDEPDASKGARDFVFEEKRDGTIVMYSDRIAAWGRASESAQRLGALSKRGGPYLSVGIGHLDTDRMKINVNNGTLTVRRRDDDEDCVQFGPHDPDDKITKLAPVDYDPKATAPEFMKFLERIQPKPEMRLFLQQWFGLSLTGDASAQKLVFLYGKGRNGKGVLVNAVAHVAGDYAQSVKIETFLDQGNSRTGDRATPDLAKLPGCRLLRCSEPEKNARLAEALIKLVTGGEPIDARHLQGDFFTFEPEFKLTIQGNYKPIISGTDEGIKSRLLLVPFDVTIPKEERDPMLINKLQKESSGILNWMLDGLRSWLDAGKLSEPEAVASATAKYFANADVLGRFLETCTVRDPGHRVQSSVLHQVYEAWCKSAGETPWKNKGFSSAMDERGYERVQSNVMWWLDLRLTKSVNDFIDINGNPIRFSDAGPMEGHDGEMEV